MKMLILVLAMAFTVQANAESVECKKNESDKKCVQRAVKASRAMNQNFYTGPKAERPTIFRAIYSNRPESKVMFEMGEGGDSWTKYLLIYRVDDVDQFMKKAAFTAELSTQYDVESEDMKVVGRSVDLDTVKLVDEEAE